mgnify:CR=1 FL=1
MFNNNIYINSLKFLGHLLRPVEVLLCIRITPYKKFRFKKNLNCEYYYNKIKFKQPRV